VGPEPPDCLEVRARPALRVIRGRAGRRDRRGLVAPQDLPGLQAHRVELELAGYLDLRDPLEPLARTEVQAVLEQPVVRVRPVSPECPEQVELMAEWDLLERLVSREVPVIQGP